jgi:hypothetical protein
LLPNYDILCAIANAKIEVGDETSSNFIAEILLRCFHFHKSLDYFGLVVIWVTAQLKSENLTPSLQLLFL